MTNKEIFEKANITISETTAPSRKEQRKAARDELEGSAPANLSELFAALSSKGFGVNFGVKLYKSGSDFVSTEAEAAYIHAKVFFGYIQNAAIRYKAAALIAEGEGNNKKSKEYTAMCERRTDLYNAIKEFCAEACIDRKCKAADAESISTFAAKFTYKGEYITEGVKYAPTSLTVFAMAFMRYIAADVDGIDTTTAAINNRLVRLAK